MEDLAFRELLKLADTDKNVYWEKLKPLLEAGELSADQYNEAYQKLSPTQYSAARQSYSIGSAKKPANDPLDLLFRDRAPLFEGEGLKKHGLQWWANYFYQECSSEKKKQAFKEIYQHNKDAPGGKELKFKYKLDRLSVPAVVKNWNTLMTGLLNDGFTEFPQEFRSTDDVLIPRVREETDLRIGFRGELRQPLDVRKHNGCRPRAHVLALLPEMNIDKGWHPFSEAATRNKLYYRKGNGDNCLHTAVSVAVDFGTASKFPLLADLIAEDDIGTATVEAEGIASNVEGVKAALAKTQTPTDTLYALSNPVHPVVGALRAAKPSEAKAPRPGIRLLRSVRMNVYLFLVKGVVYDTRGYQAHLKNAPFPERAAEAIPWDHFLARLKIDRIHYGPDSNDGHLNVIYGYEFLHYRRDLERTLGGGMEGVAKLQTLTDFLIDLYDRGKLQPDGTGGIPFTTANTPKGAKITKVIKIEPRRDWGINPAR